MPPVDFDVDIVDTSKNHLFSNHWENIVILNFLKIGSDDDRYKQHEHDCHAFLLRDNLTITNSIPNYEKFFLKLLTLKL